MKTYYSRTIAQLLFALLLTVTQGQLLIHQVDLEAHSDQSPCEICIHTSHLGSGAFGALEGITLTLNIAVYPSPNHAAADITSFYALPPSRAPPTSSLS